MKVLYLSCHSILEWDELSLFTELNYDCFSLGAYTDPAGHKSLPRPAVGGMQYHQDLEEISKPYPKTHLPQELIDWADIFIIMHQPEWITENWDRIKHKPVIWRSIGQSIPAVENMIRRTRYEGLKIVRYSPMEQNIPGYLGADAIIRFGKDPEEFKDWNGNVKRIVNFTQSLKGRAIFCHCDILMSVLSGFPASVFGPGNDNLGALNGGDLPYDLMKGQLRDCRAFVYAGTWPACYTLTPIEAMMTGIPIVSIGAETAEKIPEIPTSDRFKYFEMPAIIENGKNGFISDDIGQLRAYLHELLENHDLARRIGEAGRQTAIELFGKEKIRDQWKVFLESL